MYEKTRADHKLRAQLRGTHKAVPLTQDTFVQTLHFPGHSPNFSGPPKKSCFIQHNALFWLSPILSQLAWCYIFVMVCPFFLQPQVYSSSDMLVTLEITHFCSSKERFRIGPHELKVRSFLQSKDPAPLTGAQIRMFPTQPSKAAGRIPKARSIDATWFQCTVPVVSFYFWFVGDVEGSTRMDSQHRRLRKVRGMKGAQTPASPESVQYKSL